MAQVGWDGMTTAGGLTELHFQPRGLKTTDFHGEKD